MGVRSIPDAKRYVEMRRMTGQPRIRPETEHSCRWDRGNIFSATTGSGLRSSAILAEEAQPLPVQAELGRLRTMRHAPGLRPAPWIRTRWR